jgi:hypothetical protein
VSLPRADYKRLDRAKEVDMGQLVKAYLRVEKTVGILAIIIPLAISVVTPLWKTKKTVGRN